LKPVFQKGFCCTLNFLHNPPYIQDKKIRQTPDNNF
jgi:hypothetical protein